MHSIIALIFILLHQKMSFFDSPALIVYIIVFIIVFLVGFPLWTYIFKKVADKQLAEQGNLAPERQPAAVYGLIAGLLTAGVVAMYFHTFMLQDKSTPIVPIPSRFFDN